MAWMSACACVGSATRLLWVAPRSTRCRTAEHETLRAANANEDTLTELKNSSLVRSSRLGAPSRPQSHGRDLHGDLPAKPGARGQAEVVAAPEPAGVVPVWPVPAG